MNEYSYEFRKAGQKDIGLLVKVRTTVLRALEKIPEEDDLSGVCEQTRAYYEEAFRTDTHTAFLVFENGQFIASGGICYYSVMPTYSNPSGRKAYIMNMYTDPAHRRKGIAARILELLVKDAKNRGIYMITLEATEMSRQLYEKYGFVPMNSEMELRSEIIPDGEI